MWGRLCWIISDGRLPPWDIDTWLEYYREGTPPLVIGDAFPADAVPVPALFQAAASDDYRPTKTLPWESWLAVCGTGAFPEGSSPPVGDALRAHVVMNRKSGTALDGGLRTEKGLQPRNGLLLVAKIDDTLSHSGLETLLGELCREGWGQGRTYGYGAIRLKSIEPLEVPSGRDLSVTLGHCHPTDDLPDEGYWRWTGVPVRPHDPATRKAPDQHFTTMLLPGACFATDESHIGRTIPLDGRSDYLHYGLAPTWPACVRSDKD